MLTNNDLTLLGTKFATKEDLKQFATKKDLKQFATKKDLKQFATKKDLKQLRRDITENMATKQELVNLEDRLLGYIRQSENRVLDGLDKVVKELQDVRLEQTAHVQRHDDIDARFERIEAVPVIAQQLRKR